MPRREIGAREQGLAFGPFQLFRSQNLLLENGRPVRLGSRAFAILTALVERAGEVVGKNELTAYAWPDSFVEESNLRVHIAALRRVLGDGRAGARYIINVSGRGYSFIAPVARTEPSNPSLPTAPLVASVIPAPVTRAVGRDDAVAAVANLVLRRRLVTIVGAGGIGKSTVAVAAAEYLASLQNQRVVFVDLAAVENEPLVPTALATALGISLLVDDPIRSLLANLQPVRLLLVVDNCEHVIGSAAHLVETILSGAPHVRVLATSREPLSAQGEHVYHLAPLQSPPESASLPAVSALEFPAVQLFVERAIGSLENFQLTDKNAGLVAAMCRRLDGMPLAIELVAAQVGLFGLEALVTGLDDSLLLVAKGRRTATSRHQSLRATLDWSYRILNPLEQTLLRRLSVFKGWFSSESGLAVASDSAVGADEALDGLLSLASKSLLMTDVAGPAIRYRLLHLTRAFAAEKLAESEDARTTLYRHAERQRLLLEEASVEWETLSRAQWLTRYGHTIDDLRSALQWAFGPNGDEELGTALTVVSLPFGFQMSLIDEFKKRAVQALAIAQRLTTPRPIWVARLLLMVDSLRLRTGELTGGIATIDRAIALVEHCGADRELINPLSQRALFPLENSDYVAALAAADRLNAAAKRSDDAFASLMADRAGALVCHWSGDHARARVLAERVLRHPATVIPLVYSQAPIDRRVAMRVVLARISWVEGHADQALQLAMEAVELATSDGPTSICDALGHAACPITFWCGDAQAREYTDKLLEYSSRFTFTRWKVVGQCLDEVLRPSDDPKQRLSRDAEWVAPEPAPGLQRDLLATITERWVDSATLERAEHGRSGWCNAEVLRVIGNLRMKEGASDVAEAYFLRAARWAKDKGELAWELRAMTSAARLWQSQGRRDAAIQGLEPVYDRFQEGYETADLKAARALLEELS